MMRKWVLAVALLSLAISMGCRNIETVHVSISDAGNLSVLFVTQTEQFTATVTGVSNTAVTWSMSGTGCSGTGCGTLSSSGLYTAPPGPLSGGQIQLTITATSQADSRGSASLPVTVKDITVVLTPVSPNVGVNLTQQFVAVAVPDDAPQTFTWGNPTCTTAPCGTITPDPNNSSVAVYKAPGSPSPANDVSFAATSTVDTTGSTQATLTVVKSRLIASSTYTFRFSGFDSNGATARVGNFVVASDGTTISSGVEDDLANPAGFQHCTNLTGSFAAASNNQGKIKLNPCGASNTYTAVLDANGDIEMIESDVNGTGSGVIEPFTGKFTGNSSLSGPFVFGFTGVDAAGKRVGYVGLANMNGLSPGQITSGLMDTNDNGTASSASDLTGSYSMANGVGTMTLTSTTLGKSFNFNLYGVSGQLKANDPATLYAINTDLIGNNSAVSGTVVFQAPDSKNNYSNATFNNTSVVSLTGAANSGANVSLTIAATDGSGGLSGNFDQNDGGTIVSVSNFSTGYTYSATPSGSGRYTFMLLGDPTASPVVPPLPFVVYASAPNKGFVLDQSSSSVMTGTMFLQTAPKAQSGIFSPSNFPGTYAAASTSSGVSAVDPIVANLLLTWVNDETCTNQCVDGTEYDASGSQPVTGAYAIQANGFGTFTLTAPASSPNFVLYVIDITHVLAMDVTGTKNGGTANASIIYAQQ